MVRSLGWLLFVGGCALGTEIGDEGPALCIGDPLPLADPDAPVDGFDPTPRVWVDGAQGAYSGTDATLQITADPSNVEHTDLEPQPWEDDTPPPAGWEDAECIDSLWVPADWVLDIPGVQLDWPGDLTLTELGVTTGAVQALYADNPPPPDPTDDEPGTDTGLEAPQGELTVDPALEPATFVVDDMRRVELWVRGTFDGTGWDLDLTWVAETQPQGEDANILSLEEPVWSGRVEAD